MLNYILYFPTSIICLPVAALQGAPAAADGQRDASAQALPSGHAHQPGDAPAEPHRQGCRRDLHCGLQAGRRSRSHQGIHCSPGHCLRGLNYGESPAPAHFPKKKKKRPPKIQNKSQKDEGKSIPLHLSHLQDVKFIFGLSFLCLCVFFSFKCL